MGELTHSARLILKKHRNKCRTIVIGQKKGAPIKRFFHTQLALNIGHQPLSHDIQLPMGYYEKYLRTLKNSIRFNWPLLYETFKAIWLKFYDMSYYINSETHQNKSIKINNSVVRPEKCLFMFYWLDVGGAEKFGVDCCELARSMNKEVFVISTHLSRPFYFAKLMQTCKIYDLKRQISYNFRNQFILGLITSQRINLIHNHH